MYRRIEVSDSGEISVRAREPSPVTPGTIRLAVEYCSVNRGDIERIQGSYGGVDSTAIPFWSTTDGFFVPGYEPAGTIVEIGPGVDPALLGRRAVVHSHESCGECRYCVAGHDNLCGRMRVFGVGTQGLGGWSEQVVVPADQVLPLADGVDLAGSCTYEVTYGTALHSLRRGLELAALPGPVAVRGAPGALALAALQFCVAWDLPCVAIVRDPTGDRVKAMRSLLPQVAVAAADEGRAGVLRAAGAPPAVVIEPLGGEHVGADVELVARGGAVGVLGTHVGALSTVRTDQLFLKGVTLYGTPRAPLNEMVELAGMVADGVVTPVVDQVFELADVASALAYCEAPEGIGRVLLATSR